MIQTPSREQFARWSDEDQAKYLILRKLEAEGESLPRFIRRVFPHRPAPRHLRPLVERLELARKGIPQRVCFSVPPRHAKTEMILEANAWWLFRNPVDTNAYFSYNEAQGQSKSRKARAYAQAAGIMLRSDSASVSEWRTLPGGGLLAGGIGGALTGQGVSGMVAVDDPFKDRQDADSPVMRERVWEWFNEVVMTRLEGASVFVVHCMVGDTPVLMANGTETLLRDIHVGDSIATYAGGVITVARVLNWANQGPDDVLAIKMTSGRIVKANERHPFLVYRDGSEQWVKVRNLKVGDAIMSAGVRGLVSNARPKDAGSRQGARDTATHIITRHAGHLEFVPRPSTQLRADTLTSSIAMESRALTTTPSSLSKTGSARSALSRQERTLELTGEGNSASTTIMKPEEFAVSSAMTAISSSDTENSRKCFGRPLTTCEVIVDHVESIREAGVEDVFDIQVEGTENFIANGLISHNTRWHMDDLIGRLAAQGGWEIINIPALAEDNDILGRAPGEVLWPERFSAEALQATRSQIGEFSFAALYQGQPRPRGAALFGDATYYDPKTFGVTGKQIVLAADPAASEKTTADYSTIIALAVEGKDADRRAYVLDVYRQQVSIPQFCRDAIAFQARHGNAKLFVEAVAGFKAVPQMLKDTNPALLVQAITPKGDKFQRAQSVAAAWNEGRVMVPSGAPWLADFLAELSRFTGVKDAHDDQVDVLAYAWNNPPRRSSWDITY